MACETTSASVLGREYMLATSWSTTAVGRAAAESASAANPGIWYQRSSEAEKKWVGGRGPLWARLPHQDANPLAGGSGYTCLLPRSPMTMNRNPLIAGLFLALAAAPALHSPKMSREARIPRWLRGT